MLWKLFNRNLAKADRRSFLAQAKAPRSAVTPHPPLTQPLPGFEDLEYVDPKSVQIFGTKCTTLPNGLRIATEPIFGEYCTLGVAINVGSRYEAHYPQGISHFLEKLAFMRTKNYESHERIAGILEECCALVDCQSTRDTFLYASSCHIKSIDQVAHIIADAVQRPLIDQNDIQMCREMVANENLALARNPDCEPLLTDWIHAAAFNGNTVGLSKYCEPNSIDKDISSNHLLSYLSQYFTPERIVLAGVGVDHDQLVDIGRRYFDENQTTWATDSSLLLEKTPPVDNSLAQYTGGEIKINRDLSNVSLGPTPFPNLAHVVIGFEGVALSHPDFVPYCVLQALLGGGGSFSAGGPGKGMFTRLYVDVLHNYGWLYNATAYNHSYTDTGLFCIRASAPPEKVGQLPKIILREFARLTEKDGIEKSELERAKVQLKSQLMMNLEMRPVMFEDLARQILTHNLRKSPDEYMDAIDRVQSVDLVRAGERMLNSKMSLVGYGDLKTLPHYDAIRSLI